MRGAKAKELRRIAKAKAARSNLPEVAYATDSQVISVPLRRAIDEGPRTVEIAVGTRTLGPSQRAMEKRGKRLIGNAPIVGMTRAVRRMIQQSQAAISEADE